MTKKLSKIEKEFQNHSIYSLLKANLTDKQIASITLVMDERNNVCYKNFVEASKHVFYKTSDDKYTDCEKDVRYSTMENYVPTIRSGLFHILADNFSALLHIRSNKIYNVEHACFIESDATTFYFFDEEKGFRLATNDIESLAKSGQ